MSKYNQGKAPNARDRKSVDKALSKSEVKLTVTGICVRLMNDGWDDESILAMVTEHTDKDRDLGEISAMRRNLARKGKIDISIDKSAKKPAKKDTAKKSKAGAKSAAKPKAKTKSKAKPKAKPKTTKQVKKAAKKDTKKVAKKTTARKAPAKKGKGKGKAKGDIFD